MKQIKEKKIITYMLCISILLLTIGLYTAFASISFASPSNGAVKYDVYFSEVGANNIVPNRIIVSNNRIDIGASFSNYGEELYATTTLNNDGNVDTKLEEIKMPNIDEIIVGTSDITGNIYTLYDFISYRVYYEFNSEINEIETPNSLTINDYLKKNTSNNVAIKIALKDENGLTKDQKYVFEKYCKNGLDVNLYLEVNYTEV